MTPRDLRLHLIERKDSGFIENKYSIIEPDCGMNAPV